MAHCPACGEGNPDDAKFCKSCRTRLDGGPCRNPSEGEPVGPASLPLPDVRREGVGASTVSLVLGIIGVGVPVVGIAAIIAGVYAMRRARPHSGRARVGILLGSLGTVIFAVVLAVSLSRKDPLTRPLTPETLPQFSAAVTERLDELDERAVNIMNGLGPGAEQEMAPVYALFGEIKEELLELDSLAQEDSLEDPAVFDSLQGDILARLDQARDLLRVR